VRQNGIRVAKKRRMHTVPASYLEPWGVTQDRRTPAVWRYSRTDQAPILMAISNAAVWKDIYAFQDEAGERNTAIEDTLSGIEGAYCAARAFLVRQSPLGIDKRLAVARFIAFQLIRTPRSLQLHRDEFAHHMKDEVLSVAADPHRFHSAMRKHYDSDQACEAVRVSLLSGGWHFEADPFTGLHVMMNTIPDIWLCVCLMRWTLYGSDRRPLQRSESAGREKHG
jgi:Protein of unknown function (DUF4238)